MLTQVERAQEAIRDFHSKILLPDLLAAGSARDSQTVADQMGRVFSEHVSFMKWVFLHGTTEQIRCERELTCAPGPQDLFVLHQRV